MKKIFFPALLLAAATIPVLAMCNDSDSNQQNLRENPEIDTLAVTTLRIPSYVNLEKNVIQMNGTDWTELKMKMASSQDSIVNVLFIGDSHLQADMGTAVTRRRLSREFGYAGRGLTVPFRLAGTNEPVDYKITTDSKVNGSRLLKKPWPTHMSFTGIGVEPLDSVFTTTIAAKEPFDRVEIFFTGEIKAPADTVFFTESPYIVTFENSDTTQIFTLAGKSNATIHGFNLLDGNKGLLTHVIGNNGATFSTYNALENFGDEIAKLSPALVIISLGTNEAFGNITDAEMTASIDQMISIVKESCPEAQILLTTPSECQRKQASKRRRRRRKAASYQVNAKVKRMRDLISAYGSEHGLPVYDFYEVAGGDGSSSKWLSDAYLNKDRIHLTRAGYTLQGTLFTNALLDAIVHGE